MKVLGGTMPGIEQRAVLCPPVGLAAPKNVREGDITDTSIQVSWDRADGDFEQYEVTCTNCASAFKVSVWGTTWGYTRQLLFSFPLSHQRLNEKLYFPLK